jgi:hypothetical protein
MLTRFRQWLSILALVLPTLSLLVLGACADRGGSDEQDSRLQPGPDLAASVGALNLSGYGVTEVASDPDSDAVTVSFSNGTRVVVRSNLHPVEGEWELRAVSSDGTTAERTSWKGWPVIDFVDQNTGNLKRGTLYLARTAKDELDQWQEIGNRAAFALIALDISAYADLVGEYDLTRVVRVFSEADEEAPSGGGGVGFAAPKQAAPSPDGGDLTHSCNVFNFSDEECVATPAQKCLNDVVQTGWWPCAKYVLATLVTALTTYWFCGACARFLITLAPALLGYISNPFGLFALLVRTAICVGCVASAWGEFEAAKRAFMNCFRNHPPPKGCAGPTPTATEVN